MAPVTVRALESEDEVRAFMRLATAQFVGGQDLLGLQGSRPSEPAEVRWWRFLETAPHAHPGQWRGAFDGPDLRGGYTLEERSLRIGAARLRTGCVGAVVADPAHRGRGVGRAMMWDAVAQAEEREQALLLLFGVPGFYARFGYGDVADVAEHAISADRIPAQTDATIAVREATPDDAPALLELYERHDARYAGSFVRSLEHQRHQIQHRARERPLLVAVDAAANALRGSLAFAYGPWWRDPAQAHEVAADTWPATLALLQRHLSLLGGGACTGAPGVAGETGGAPPVLRWQAPPDSMVVYHLADHLPLLTTTAIAPNQGWQARPGHLEALRQAMLPEWEQRLAGTAFAGAVPHLRALSAAPGAECAEAFSIEAGAAGVTLASRVFVALLFGYRPATWAAAQPGHHVQPDALARLSALFPPRRPWIPGADAF